jgi:hypothetical protein
MDSKVEIFNSFRDLMRHVAGHLADRLHRREAGTRDSFGKVYIDGIGFMKDGRRLRDGREKADDRKLYRDRPSR